MGIEKAFNLSETYPVESSSLAVESPDSLLALGVFVAARSPPRMVSLRFCCPPSGVRLRAGDGSRDGADGIVGPRSGAMHGNVIAFVVCSTATTINRDMRTRPGPCVVRIGLADPAKMNLRPIGPDRICTRTSRPFLATFASPFEELARHLELRTARRENSPTSPSCVLNPPTSPRLDFCTFTSMCTRRTLNHRQQMWQ